MAQDYIPAANAQCADWMDNFSSRVTATPTAFGLTAPIAVIIASLVDPFLAALAISTAPATRTSVTTAATLAAKTACLAGVRPYAQQVKANPVVTDDQRVELGLTVDSFPPTPIPAPTTFPVLVFKSASHLLQTFGYYDTATPTTKAKPPGVVALEIVRSIGLVPATDPTQCVAIGSFNKSPLSITFGAGDVGKIATFFGRWRTQSGPGGVAQYGPWSTATTINII